MLVPRWGKHVVTSLVLVLILVLFLILLHVVHDMGHPLHLHSYQLLHGHGLVHRRSIGIGPTMAIVVVVVGLAIVSTVGTAPSVDRHLMYRNNIIKSGVVHMCKSDLEM